MLRFNQGQQDAKRVKMGRVKRATKGKEARLRVLAWPPGCLAHFFPVVLERVDGNAEVVGDKVVLGPVTLVARATEADRVTKVGLKMDNQ